MFIRSYFKTQNRASDCTADILSAVVRASCPRFRVRPSAGGTRNSRPEVSGTIFKITSNIPIRCLLLLTMLLAATISISAQANQYKVNPPSKQAADDDTERVTTEEIKLNVSVKNDYGHFDPSLIAADLMVVEDRVPHKIESLRRAPANVLIVLDTGGELRFAKNLKTTRQVAVDFVSALSKENSLALMQYSDKPEILVEWTTDPSQILEAIFTKTNFGKRSKFTDAMNLAAKFLSLRPNENRHLVLVTDGTDSSSEAAERDKAIQNLVAANVSVHVLSYTALELSEMKDSGGGIFQKGEARAPRRTDDAHKASLPQPVQDMMNLPRLGSINTDTTMMRARSARRNALKQSQEQLKTLAEVTGGEIFLPASLDEMPTQAREVAATIGANYVVTYVPKQSLATASAGEIREITVVPRRVGLVIQARRKFVVPARKQADK